MGQVKTETQQVEHQNPVALSYAHETSVSKYLDGTIPAISHISLSWVTSTSYMQLSMADVS